MTTTSPKAVSALARTTGWITLGALLAIAPQLIACEDTEVKETSSATVSSPQAAVQADRAGTYVNQLPEPPATAEAPATTLDEKVVAAKAPSAIERSQTQITAAEDGQPFVKRLVIAGAVEEREPVELTEIKVAEPILAFVELQNLGETESGVVVTFEHESGKKVGFVELSVPAESNRYRTWARTHNIQEPGTWTAVVKSKAGEELARKSFTVSG